MSVERWWSRSRPIPRSVEAETDPCPICVHLNRWYGEPIEGATHGAGGPNWGWRACYEHYKVIAAFDWLGLTRHVETPGECQETAGDIEETR